MRAVRHSLCVAVVAALLSLVSSADQANFQTFQARVVPACPDAPPPVAAGFGMNTCVFFDPMTSLSTIDVNANGLAPSTGVNWYTQADGNYASYQATIVGTAMTTGTPTSGTIAAGQTVGYGGDTCTPTPGTQIVSGSGNSWVITPSQSCSGSVISSFAQAPSTLSAGPNGLTISNVSQANDNFGIATYAYLNHGNGTGPAVYRGTTFRMAKGFLVRGYFSWDNSLAPNTNTYGLTNLRWPAWWGTTQPGVPVTIPYTYQYVEADICDCFPVGGNNPPVNLNNFIYDEGNGGTNASNNFGSGGNYVNFCNPVFDGNTFHTIDFLWVPTTLNSGAGLFAYLIDEDTCPGNAVFNGSISGTTLTVNSVAAGSLKINSFIACGGCANHTQIMGGSAPTWTLNNGSSVSNITMVASDQNNCSYYLSPGTAGCQTQGYAGAYAIGEIEDQGFTMIISSGCTNYWSDPTMAPTATSTTCTGATGSWPMHIKWVQAWCVDMSCKRVQNFLLRRDLDPASNDNTPMWLNRAA